MLATVMAAPVQLMAARLGLVTGHSLPNQNVEAVGADGRADGGWQPAHHPQSSIALMMLTAEVSSSAWSGPGDSTDHSAFCASRTTDQARARS